MAFNRSRREAFAHAYPARLAATVAVAAALLGGCERQPNPDALRDWAPADHDRAEEQAAQSNQGQPATPDRAPAQQARPTPAARGPAAGGASAGDATGNGNGKADANATLIEATWEAACAPCHGPVGHGDGPNGPMVNAPDITRAEVLGSVTDDEIASQIRNGKNRMPKFDLPDPVVRGLVARIRANRGR